MSEKSEPKYLVMGVYKSEYDRQSRQPEWCIIHDDQASSLKQAEIYCRLFYKYSFAKAYDRRDQIKSRESGGSEADANKYFWERFARLETLALCGASDERLERFFA